MKLNTPMPSTREGKKRMVFVKNPKTGRINTIHYGDTDYEDFTQHRDEKRRASFRARHNCDEAKDKLTARYWVCEDLW